MFGSIFSWCDVFNLQYLIFPRWLEQTCNRTNLLNPNFKRIICSVLCYSVFHYVHFQRVGDLKTRFLDNDHFVYSSSIVIMSVFFKFIIVFNQQFLCWFEQTCNRTYVLKSNIKGIVISVLICWLFIMFIFSVLVTWEHDFWTMIILPKQTI